MTRNPTELIAQYERDKQDIEVTQKEYDDYELYLERAAIRYESLEAIRDWLRVTD